MAAEQRKLLEQLMGAEALGDTDRYRDLKITDPQVCRSYLVGQCPHDLFTNTKQDLGPCPKIHSEALRSEYQSRIKANPHEPDLMVYQWEYMKDLERHVSDCNRRIDMARRRLERTPEEVMQVTKMIKEMEDMNQATRAAIEEMEVLGEMDLIARCLDEYYLILLKTQEIEGKEREQRAMTDAAGPSGNQKLTVCDVCGAYLSKLDNDRRLADHFGGKMHLGYVTMRNAYKEIQTELGSYRPPPSALRSSSPNPGSRHTRHDAGGPRRGGGGGGAGAGRRRR